MDIGDIIIISNGNRNFRAIAQVKSDYFYDKNTPISHTHFRKVEWLYKGEDIYYSKINDKIFSQQSIYGYFSPSKKGPCNTLYAYQYELFAFVAIAGSPSGNLSRKTKSAYCKA
jgi:hypothetical protein